MRSATSLGMLLSVLVLSTGCYHATVDTGRTPSGQTIEVPWASSFIAGLVPPSTVETAARCPSGVARVETQLSFLNMVANVVTFGIYSPMTITVQCAAAGENDEDSALTVPQTATSDEAVQVFNAAVQQARASGQAVHILFE